MKRVIALLVVLVCAGLAFGQNVISVFPGDGALTQALAEAVDGDTLELSSGAVYTESTLYLFGSIIDKDITITVENDAEFGKATLQFLTPPDGESVMHFFEVGNNASLTLEHLELDGSSFDVATADYAIDFTLGEVPAETWVNKISVKDCYIHDFVGDVIAAGDPEARGYLIIDSTFVDNVIMENTGTTIYYKYCGANYISVKNSTFNTINSYGLRVSGPIESNQPLNTPSVDIDHTTWYNIGTDDSREIIQCEKGPHLGAWHVSNSIFVKQVNKDRTAINIKDLVSDANGQVNNINLWDVGGRAWREMIVSDTLAIDPEFADPENGDFTLPAGSQLLTFGSDGKAIGDPRWATNATAVETERALPLAFALQQNYPNPFNPETTIRFSLDRAGYTTLVVYDLLGRQVANLVQGNLTAGEHRVSFQANGLPSGIYFYRLQSGNRTLTSKMTLLE